MLHKHGARILRALCLSAKKNPATPAFPQPCGAWATDARPCAPVLQHAVLLAAGGVVGGHVCHAAFPPEEVAGLAVDVQGVPKRLTCRVHHLLNMGSCQKTISIVETPGMSQGRTDSATEPLPQHRAWEACIAR